MSPRFALRRRARLAAVLALCAFATLALSLRPASADATKKTYDSITRMLKDGGFESEAHPEIPGHLLKFQGKGIGEFNVVVLADEARVTVLSYVARPGKVDVTPKLMADLNKVNADYSLVKVVVDGKGNLVFRYDIYEEMVDTKYLKNLLDIITASTIHFYNDTPWIKK